MSSNFDKMQEVGKMRRDGLPVRVEVIESKCAKFKSNVGIIKTVDKVDYHILMTDNDGRLKSIIICLGEFEISESQPEGKEIKKWKKTILKELISDSLDIVNDYIEKANVAMKKLEKLVKEKKNL